MTAAATCSISPGQGSVPSVNVQENGNKTSHKGLCGRHIVGTVANAGVCAVKAVVKTTHAVVDKIFWSLGNLSETTNELAAACRKLHKHSLHLIGHLTKSPEKFGKLIKILSSYVGYIDFLQVAADVDYFVRGKFKKENFLQVGAHIACFVANVGGALLWLEDMAFINLSKATTAIGNWRAFEFVPKVLSTIPVLRDMTVLQKAAKAIGELRVFSVLTKVSPLTIVLRAIDLAYAFLAIEAANRLIKSEKKEQKISAGLDLSSYVAELVLSAVILAGVTNIIALGSIGGGCIVLALSAFLYRSAHEKQLDPTFNGVV